MTTNREGTELTVYFWKYHRERGMCERYSNQTKEQTAKAHKGGFNAALHCFFFLFFPLPFVNNGFLMNRISTFILLSSIINGLPKNGFK